MALHNERMTVAELIEALEAIDGATELPIKMSNYEGGDGFHIYSVRKHVVTDEEGEITDAFVVMNG